MRLLDEITPRNIAPSPCLRRAIRCKLYCLHHQPEKTSASCHRSKNTQIRKGPGRARLYRMISDIRHVFLPRFMRVPQNQQHASAMMQACDGRTSRKSLWKSTKRVVVEVKTSCDTHSGRTLDQTQHRTLSPVNQMFLPFLPRNQFNRRRQSYTFQSCV